MSGSTTPPGTGTTLTIGGLVGEARALLNDTVQTAGAGYRYSDDDLVSFINAGLREARMKRPDFFLSYGLRVRTPIYTSADLALTWPVDESLYNPVLYYVVGRAEVREDTFTDDGRAKLLMDKFVSTILGVG
jgi:hypothetical protein